MTLSVKHGAQTSFAVERDPLCKSRPRLHLSPRSRTGTKKAKLAYLGFSVGSLIPGPKSGMMKNNNFPLVVKFPTFPNLFGL